MVMSSAYARVAVRPARLDEVGLLAGFHATSLWSVPQAEGIPGLGRSGGCGFPGFDETVVRRGRYVVSEVDGSIAAGGGWVPTCEAFPRDLPLSPGARMDEILPSGSAVAVGLFEVGRAAEVGALRRVLQHMECDVREAGHAQLLVLATGPAALVCCEAGYRDICPLPLEVDGRVLPLLRLGKRVGSRLGAVA